MELQRRPNFLVRHAALLFGSILSAFPVGIAGDLYRSNVLCGCAVVLGLGSFALLIVGIFYELLTRMQWPLLELLLSVFGGSLAMIYGIRGFGIRANALTAMDVATLAFYLAAGLLVTFPGTLLALEWIHALKIQHALVRAALVLLAWASLLSPISILIGIGCVIMAFGSGSTILGAVNRPQLIAASEYLSAALIFVPVIWVQRRARGAGQIRI